MQGFRVCGREDNKNTMPSDRVANIYSRNSTLPKFAAKNMNPYSSKIVKYIYGQ